jgi:hypothetical protein
VLTARIVSRRPLRYRGGADPALDRPAHLRAASGLTYAGAALVVVQDDAAFLGVVDPVTGLVDDVALPAGAGGRRIFDAGLGNKADKPDLEAVFADGDTVVAFGSGGPLPARRVVVTWRRGEAPRVVPAGRFLDALAAACLPGATALNLEGAAIADGALWIANRGGDHAGGDVSPDAIVRVDLAGWRGWLADPEAAALPALAVTRHALGELDGGALHFSDLAPAPAGLLYLAAAEATTSFFDDGAVRGSVLGVIAPGVAPRHAAIRDAGGALARDKVEGVTLVRGARDRAFAVVDADDPDRPADLLELALEGPWWLEA